ncbi:Multidrug resistance-associated protein/mitoxantrone resistance protein, ABC superfamily [Phaffia rhodozyma]|uniref:Multidrug resistance-associated protein/mitoxantrone resistance protein, ABC superfamily n=1 Tax=Phaffia rhodozyma TaxID=264483 RepID=A0A0F7ST81_PHARH|nr:Multidrug resistance-associated protein/mitoxantrone resistance protein, ABC superfamily [Phaffia rhodozyma]
MGITDQVDLIDESNWIVSDGRRRILNFLGCLAELIAAVLHLSYSIGHGQTSSLKPILFCLYWFLPLSSLGRARWHLPSTILLLPPIYFTHFQAGSTYLQVISIILFFLSGTAQCEPERQFIPQDFDKDFQISETGTEQTEKECKGNVGGSASSSVLGWLFFQWPLPLLRLSQSKPLLYPSDLPHLPRKLRSREILSRPAVKDMFDKLLAGQKHTNETESWKLLLRLLWNTNRTGILVLLLLAVIKALLTFLPAYILSLLIQSLEKKSYIPSLSPSFILSQIASSPTPTESNSSYPTKEQITLCVALAATGALSGILSSHQAYWDLENVSEPIKIQLRALLFQKTLRRMDIVALPTSTDEGAGGVGKTQVLNLFTVDVARLAGFGSDAAGVIIAFVDLVIGTTLLYRLLGPSAFVGILLNTASIPLNKSLASITFDVDRRRSLARDQRIAGVDEVLGGIRTVKFEAAEHHWEKKLGMLRNNEVRLQRLRYHLGTLYNLIWGSLPILCLLITFTIFTKIQHGDLIPSVAFPSLAIFNSLTQVWTILPGTFIKLTEGLVSLQRLAGYLRGSEVQPVARTENFKDNSFRIIDATILYPSSRSDVTTSSPPTSLRPFSLRSISISIPPNALTLVCGPVASGKSLLLLSLLGEADLLEGSIGFPRTLDSSFRSEDIMIKEEEWLVEGSAFVPQTPWLQSGSIQSNILFGLPFNRSRYLRVLEVCSLNPDLEIFPDKDLTEIGENGRVLSGGQKARISLARAIYSRAKHLVIDDIMSAVDAHTAQIIYEKCLKGPMVADRTVVLVTHHVSLCLSASTQVIALDNGCVQYSGDSDTFATSPHFQDFLREEDEEAQREEELVESLESTFEDLPSNDNNTKHKSPVKLIKKETREEGNISSAAYIYFLSSCGGMFYWTAFTIVYLGTQALDLLTAWWLRKWTDAAGLSHPARSLDYYLAIYACITFFGVIASALRWIILYNGATTRASSIIHQRLLKNVLHEPLRYFESTAHGTLLNRFSVDMSRVDGFLPDDWARVVMYTLSLASSVGVITIITPSFLWAIAVIAPIIVVVGIRYAKITRDLRRLDSVSLSPLFSLWSEVISGGGILVVRAFGSSSSFMDRMLSNVDAQTSRYFHGFSVYLWLITTFTGLNGILIGSAGLILLYSTQDAALAGFSLTFAMSISSGMLDLMLRYVSLELTMVAVERIKQFSEDDQKSGSILKSESTAGVHPPAAWPMAGEIRVQNLCVRYAPHLPDALSDISFHVRPGEKVGVCGPTGSGKSSLALSFFRFMEAYSGQIILDDLDISKLMLNAVRSRLTIIPQDPTIMSGTLRSALDLYDECTDSEIFDALRRVHLLKDSSDTNGAPDMDEGQNDSVFSSLDNEVAQHGSNFSQGQRQLLLLARALLRRSKVMILDEATSSIDFATDHLLTATIQEAFQDSTLLVIAHRLRTIIQYDKVLFLLKGKVMEYDSPRNLLQNPSSHFYQLCQSSGELSELKRLAELNT